MKNLLYLLLTAAVFTSCSQENPKDKRAELDRLRKEESSLHQKIAALQTELALTDTTERAPREVSVTEIKSKPFNHYIEVQGKVDGDENVVVSPEVPGTVMKVNVSPGAKVNRGTILASMDNGVYMKSLEELQSQRDFVNTLYLKQQTLWEQKIGTEVQYLSAKNNLESIDRKLATVRQQVAQTTIKSPINGTVDAVNIKIGQTVSPGMAAFRVVNFSKLKVKAEVAEAFITKINKGDMVDITFPDIHRSIVSEVAYSGQAIDPLNRTFNVEVYLDASEKDLNPNMVAILKIADYARDSSFTLPVSVVQSTPEGSYVFLAVNRGGKMIAQKQPVIVGQNYNGILEILSGLKGGEPVITSGFQDLADGQPVKL